MKFEGKYIHGLLNCISDGVFVTDGEGNIVMLNKASAELSEFKEDELLGRNVRDLVDAGYFGENGTVFAEMHKQRQ